MSEEQSESTPKSKIKSRNEMAQAEMPKRTPTPTSILLYVAIVVISMLYGLVVPGEPALAVDQRLAVTIFIRLLLIFLLVNRSFVGWVLAALFESLQIILIALQIEPPGNPKIWGTLFMHTAALALLLTRATRAHVWSAAREKPPGPRTRAEIEADEERRQADASSSSSN